MASGGEGDGQILSQDFAHQIRHLEQEGKKLMAATQSLQTSLMSSTGKSNSSTILRVSSPLNVASGLSALTDITEDQQTISRLSESLDASTRDTENLRQHLRGSQPLPYSSPLTSRYNPNLLSSLEVPDSSYHVGFQTSTPMSYQHSHVPALHAESTSRLETAKTYTDIPMQSHLEQELRESKEESADLRTKVREAIRIAEEQKSHFRVSIDELKTQLHQTVREKESVFHSKTKELKAHEATIHRQQANITQLEQANKIQEETLLEMNGKLEALQHDHYAMDALFAQVKTMILDRETKRGRPFYEREPALKQTPSMLAHSLERCLQELEFEITEKSRRLSEATIELEEYKASWKDRQQLISQEQKDRLSQQTENHEREMKSSSEHLQAARRQVASLQDELTTIKDEYEATIREKNEMLRKHRSQVADVVDEKDAEIAKWKEKVSAMEITMDQIEKEITLCRCEKDEAIKKLVTMETKCDELKQSIPKLESQLEMERFQALKLVDQEAKTKKQLEVAVSQLESKSKELGELKESVGSMRREFDQQMQQTLRNLNEEQKEKSSMHLIDMSRQVSDALEKYQDTKLQLEVLKAEHRNLTEQYQQILKRNEVISSQLEETKTTKDHLSTTLQERLADVERLTQEKDAYFKMLGEKEKEFLLAKGEAEKSQLQLEEKVVQLHRMSDQHQKLTELHTTLEKQLQISQGEQEKLIQTVHQHELEKQEILNSRDNIIKRLKLREKHLKDVEDDNNQMATHITEFKQEIEVLKKEKFQSDTELAAVQKVYDELQTAKKKVEKSLHHDHDNHKREVKKLNAKLQAMEEEVKFSQKAVKAQKEMDGRAVKVAGKMQKEVTEKRSQIDSLNTKVRWLEESLDNILKSKEGAAEQIDVLTDKLTASKQHQESLKYEIDDLNRQNLQLKDRAARMEATLEKAAVKHAETKAKLENYQQEVARLKLKHQLEIKEVSRNGGLRLAENKRTFFTPVVNLRTLDETTKRNNVEIVEESPVKEKPVNTRVQNYMEDNTVGHELRGLLSEMRDMLSDHRQQQNVYMSPERIPRREKDFLDSRSDPEFDIVQTDKVSRTVNVPQPEAYSLNTNLNGRTTRHLPEKPVASFYGEDSLSISEIMEDKDYNDPGSLRGNYEEQQINEEMRDKIQSIFRQEFLNQQDRQDLVRPAATATNSSDLYKRLEGKIADLAELGSHLQKENLEIHDIILSSGEQLDKLKGERKA